MNAITIAVSFASDVTHRFLTSPETKAFVKSTEEKAKAAIVRSMTRLLREKEIEILGHYQPINVNQV